MAYITKFNFSRLLANRQTIGKGLIMEGSEHELYPHRDIEWFNDLEASRLFLCKIMLLNENHVLFEKMLGNHWLKIYTPDDNFRLAVAPKKPRYHHDAACPCLHTPEFRNFELPVNFKDIYGEAEVLRFREWLQIGSPSPMQIFSEDASRFKNMCEARWTRVSWHNVALRNHENSGIALFHNFNLQKLELYINQLLDDYQLWLDTLPEHSCRMIKANVRYLNNVPKEIAELLETFKLKFKNPMRNALLAYYYQTAMESNVDMMAGSALQALGFEPCAKCCGKHSHDEW